MLILVQLLGTTTDRYSSLYSKVFLYFKDKVDEYFNKYWSSFNKLPRRIMDNCILLPIEADKQDTALRIFSTLNDRGKPLADADIFKARLYNFYKEKGIDEKNKFVDRWKLLESKCKDLFGPYSRSPLDELFTMYMYYLRAKKGITKSTTVALRKFFEASNTHDPLKNDDVMKHLSDLIEFWDKVYGQNRDYFSVEALRKLFVLWYMHNGMWEYLLSVYFLSYKDDENRLDNGDLIKFLDSVIAISLGYQFYLPGLNALRTPVYKEMKNIVNHDPKYFTETKLNESKIRNTLENYEFSNQRKITKAMLVWWAFENENQQYINLSQRFDIEHIYARKRYEFDKDLSSESKLESLGNKSILERNINIRAADYKFNAKKKYYLGEDSESKNQNPTCVQELIKLADKEDFTEDDINTRKSEIINGFISYLRKNDLLSYE